MNIKEAYQLNRLPKLVKLLTGSTCPSSYQNYCKRFLEKDKIDKECWYSEGDLKKFLKIAGFKDIEITKPFAGTSFNLIAWLQFVWIARGKNYGIKFTLLRLWVLKIIDKIVVTSDKSNAIFNGKK